MACWPPEVSISNPPEEQRPLTTSTGSNVPAASPTRDPSGPVGGSSPPASAPQGSAPQVSAPSASAPAQPDAGPCGLENTPCCPPANACAEDLSCVTAVGLCVAEDEASSTTGPAASAPTYVLRSSPGPEQVEHGGVGGGVFSSFCPADQVVIGMRAISDDSVWGLGLDCGRLELSPAGDALDVLPLDQLPVFGGNLDPQPPLVEFSCPPQMVITAASWTLWQPFVDMQQVLKQLQLSCSEIKLGPDRSLQVGPATAVLAAGTVEDSTSPVLQTCGERGVVSGLTGRSGGAIDSLATRCVTLSVDVL